MLMLNKIVVEAVGAPAFLLLAQLLLTSVAVGIAAALKFIHVEPVPPKRFQGVLISAGGFLLSLLAAFKALQLANVDTFIVFRCSTPLLLAIADALVLGRSLPSLRSWAALALLLLSCAGFALSELSELHSDAIFWLLVWVVLFSIDAAWVKYWCSSFPMGSWSRALWTNVLAGMLLVGVWPWLPAGERGSAARAATLVVGGTGTLPLAASCVLALCVSHATFLLREATTAAGAAVVGVLCKLLTVAINLVVWDKHASPTGMSFLMGSIVAAACYQQAPPRVPPVPAAATLPGGGGRAGSAPAAVAAALPGGERSALLMAAATARPAAGGSGAGERLLLPRMDEDDVDAEDGRCLRSPLAGVAAWPSESDLQCGGSKRQAGYVVGRAIAVRTASGHFLPPDSPLQGGVEARQPRDSCSSSPGDGSRPRPAAAAAAAGSGRAEPAHAHRPQPVNGERLLPQQHLVHHHQQLHHHAATPVHHQQQPPSQHPQPPGQQQQHHPPPAHLPLASVHERVRPVIIELDGSCPLYVSAAAQRQQKHQ